jgi:hypothetical protein
LCLIPKEENKSQSTEVMSFITVTAYKMGNQGKKRSTQLPGPFAD